MAIDFPPALPPEHSTEAALNSYAATEAVDAAIRAQLKDGSTIEVSGNRYLPTTRVRELIAAASSTELAASALSIAYHDAGHLLVRVFHSSDGHTPRIQIVHARLKDVQTPKPLDQYFNRLVGDTDLTAAEFERRRLPAAIHSDYSGTDYTVSYKSGTNPQDLTLVLTAKHPNTGSDRDIAIGLNNHGNRFLGRYFATAGLVQGFEHGGQLSIAVNSLVEAFGDRSGGRRYNALALGYQLVRPHGLYSIEAKREEYTRTALVNADTGQTLTGMAQIESLIVPSDSEANLHKIDLDARVDHLRVASEQLWYANRDTRFATIARLKYSDNIIEDEAGNPVIEESTTSLEIGAVYTTSMGDVDIAASGFVDFGIAGNAQASRDSDGIFDRGTGYTIWRPRLELGWELSEATRLRSITTGQLTDDEVTEHQQFVLGGPRVLAAWLPGVIIGDSGYHTVFSAIFSSPRIFNTTLPIEIFVESGAAEFEGNGSASGEKIELADAGVRISLQHPGGWSSELVAARPIDTSDVRDERLDFFEAAFFWTISYVF